MIFVQDTYLQQTRRARTASAPMCHGTRIPLPWYPLPLYPWYPIPTTYIHTCIDTFVLFIYLSYCLCLYLSYCLCLSYSSLLSCFLSSRSLLALGKAYPLGRGSRSYPSCACKCFILFNYYPVVYMYGRYVCIYMYCIVYVYVSSIMYVPNRCMYVNDVVCIVLCACGPVYV